MCSLLYFIYISVKLFLNKDIQASQGLPFQQLLLQSILRQRSQNSRRKTVWDQNSLFSWISGLCPAPSPFPRKADSAHVTLRLRLGDTARLEDYHLPKSCRLMTPSVSGTRSTAFTVSPAMRASVSALGEFSGGGVGASTNKVSVNQSHLVLRDRKGSETVRT